MSAHKKDTWERLREALEVERARSHPHGHWWLKPEQLTVGASVWVRFGSFGWRPALVEGGTLANVRVRYLCPNRGIPLGGGRCPLDLLAVRDPAVKGKDKPSSVRPKP